mmetsp:Transcript_80803/g.240827  ORF Transcript_80803/g.240827 Transcript_80803/m.240827 type:complete len:263 (-) Transcript_80803:1009-1797(-)
MQSRAGALPLIGLHEELPEPCNVLRPESDGVEIVGHPTSLPFQNIERVLHNYAEDLCSLEVILVARDGGRFRRLLSWLVALLGLKGGLLRRAFDGGGILGGLLRLHGGGLGGCGLLGALGRLARSRRRLPGPPPLLLLPGSEHGGLLLLPRLVVATYDVRVVRRCQVGQKVILHDLLLGGPQGSEHQHGHEACSVLAGHAAKGHGVVIRFRARLQGRQDDVVVAEEDAGIQERQMPLQLVCGESLREGLAHLQLKPQVCLTL